MGSSTVHDTRVHQARVPFCTDSLFIRTSLIKNWPLSTRTLWAWVLCVVPESIKLKYHSVLAIYFIWTSFLTLSIFWNPAYPHSHSYSLITHFLNLPLTLSISLSTLSDFLNLAIKLSHTLSFSVSLSLSVSLLLCCSISLSLCCSVSLSLCCSCSRSPSHKVCLAQLAYSVWALGICGYLCL